MNHSFECKCIGKISPDLLERLKSLAQNLDYLKVYEWVLKQSEFIEETNPEIQQVIQEINGFMRVSSMKFAAFAMMPPMSYAPEHSDTYISKTPPTEAKIHIPVITNDKVGFMWPGKDAGKDSFVTRMDEGSIYLFNNVARHSVVNLSDKKRFHLIMEFREAECVE